MEVCSIHPLERRTHLRVCVPEILCVFRFAARRGSDVPFWVSRRHVVVFSVQMRKIFPFGVPRGALADHIAPSKLFPIRKSPGCALQASDERESMTLQPTPNGNILHICACFLTRWLSLARLHLGNPPGPSRRLGNEKSSHRGRVSCIKRWFVGKRWGDLITFIPFGSSTLLYGVASLDDGPFTPPRGMKKGAPVGKRLDSKVICSGSFTPCPGRKKPAEAG